MFNITKLEQLIADKGWSNAYFCQQMQRNRGWITDMKRGIGLPDFDTIVDMAFLLDTSVEYLTDQTDDKRPATFSGEPDDFILKFAKLLTKLSREDIEAVYDMMERLARNSSKDK